MPSAIRNLLGLAALLSLTAGAAALAWRQAGVGGEVLIRAGVMLAAFWLVAPLVRHPKPTTAAMAAVAALVMVRPRLLAPAVVGAIIWWLAARGGRQRSGH